MKIYNLIKNREVVCARTGQTVQEVAELMARNRIGAVPILDGENLVGIFTERDLLHRIVAEKKNPNEVKIEEVMTRELIVAPPECRIKECISLMKKYKMRHILIVKEKDLVGIISLRDLLQVEMDDQKFEIKVLNEYIHYIPPFHKMEE